MVRLVVVVGEGRRSEVVMVRLVVTLGEGLTSEGGSRPVDSHSGGGERLILVSPSTVIFHPLRSSVG